jgi:hypothetical protein
MTREHSPLPNTYRTAPKRGTASACLCFDAGMQRGWRDGADPID